MTYRWMKDIIKSGLSPILKGQLMDYSITNSNKKTKNMIYLLKNETPWEKSVEMTEIKFKL